MTLSDFRQRVSDFFLKIRLEDGSPREFVREIISISSEALRGRSLDKWDDEECIPDVNRGIEKEI